MDKDEPSQLSHGSRSIARALSEATAVLKHAGISEPRREAASLLAHVIDRDRTFLISHSEDMVQPSALSVFYGLVERRTRGEPQQYIIGHQQFFGLDFKVTPDVLIPRPETELLVEAALKLVSNSPSAKVCDVGTGSGCIAVSLLHEQADARALAIDLSEPAIQIARENARRHAVNERMSLLVCDCLSALNPAAARFDLIVSNPPYVSASALVGLQKEVRNHEPQMALTPGGDGLSIIRRLLQESPKYLKSNGYLLFEIGFDQGETVREMIASTVWRVLDIQPDLQGIPRIVALQKVNG